MTEPDKTFLREGEAMAFLGFTRKQWRNLRASRQDLVVRLPGYTCAHFRTAQLRQMKEELEGKVKV